MESHSSRFSSGPFYSSHSPPSVYPLLCVSLSYGYHILLWGCHPPRAVRAVRGSYAEQDSEQKGSLRVLFLFLSSTVAAAFEELSLASPTKRAEIEPLKLVDDRQQTATPASVAADEVDDTRDNFDEAEITEEQLKQCYINDIHLPEDQEPLLIESKRRFVLFPIQYPEIWKKSKKGEASFWTAEEMDLSKDLHNWQNRLNNNVTESTRTLLNDSLMKFKPLKPAASTDQDERECLFDAVETIKKNLKVDWALWWISDTKLSFAERLIAFAAVEGIFFSGAFALIFWLKKHGLMPGLTFSNELISRDEGMHTDFACLIHSHLKRRPHPDIVKRIVTEAVDVEQEFLTDVLPCALIGMNSDWMSQYIEFVADRLLVALGTSKVYNAINPFDFMDMISLKARPIFSRSVSWTK